MNYTTREIYKNGIRYLIGYSYGRIIGIKAMSVCHPEVFINKGLIGYSTTTTKHMNKFYGSNVRNIDDETELKTEKELLEILIKIS